jgi:hypothetical protein
MEPINLMNLYQNRLENPGVVYQSKSFQQNNTKKENFLFRQYFPLTYIRFIAQHFVY